MSTGPAKVTKSRFEIEEAGEIAHLDFEMDSSGWMTLLHTEVPPALRGRGLGGELAKTALDYARDQHLKVDVLCPYVTGYIEKHPEYKPLLRAK